MNEPAPLRFAPIAKVRKDGKFGPRIVENEGTEDEVARLIAPISRIYDNPKDALADVFEVVDEFQKGGYDRGRAAGVEETRREVLQLKADVASVKAVGWKEGHADGFHKGKLIGEEKGSLRACLICFGTIAILLGLIAWSGVVKLTLT